MSKSICSTCSQPILRAHRWRTVHHVFLWWHWETRHHRNCQKPTEGPERVRRLKGEVPLPFEEPDFLPHGGSNIV